MTPRGEVLAQLALIYRADRAAIDARHPPALRAELCRYCGDHWQRWKGSAFDGHVACAVSPAFLRQIIVTFETLPGLGIADLALALAVSPSVVRAWWNVAKGNPRP